jgi:hypothetical protein
MKKLIIFLAILSLITISLLIFNPHKPTNYFTISNFTASPTLMISNYTQITISKEYCHPIDCLCYGNSTENIKCMSYCFECNKSFYNR